MSRLRQTISQDRADVEQARDEGAAAEADLKRDLCDGLIGAKLGPILDLTFFPPERNGAQSHGVPDITRRVLRQYPAGWALGDIVEADDIKEP